MAFITTRNRQNLDRAFLQAQELARRVRERTQTTRDRAAAGNITAYEILNSVYSEFKGARDSFQTLASVEGIAAYAQGQFPDLPGYDIATEFTAMTTAIDGVLSWVRANFPDDGGGFLLALSFDVDDTIKPAEFTPAQTVGLRSALDAVLLAID